MPLPSLILAIIVMTAQSSSAESSVLGLEMISCICMPLAPDTIADTGTPSTAYTVPYII